MNVKRTAEESDERRRIVVYGAGGLGREVLQMVRLMFAKSGAQVLGFLDDGVEPGTIRNEATVLSGLD